MNHFKKITNRMMHPLSIAVFGILMLLCYFWLDKSLAEYFYQLQPGKAIPGLIIFTEVGKSFIYVLLFGSLALFFRFIRRQARFEARACFLLLCVLIPNLLCLFLKVGFGRARPELWLEAQQYGFFWFKFSKMYWSFPSSHTCTITGLLLGLGILFPRSVVYLLIPAMLVIASRIFLYQHYLSDVLAAVYLTFASIGILVCCIQEQQWFLRVK